MTPRPPISKKDLLETQVCPLFNKHMGRRMAIARMLTLRSQGEIASLLSTKEMPVGQASVSGLESGALRFAGFTLDRLRSVFGKHTEFILYGTQADRYDENFIVNRFWSEKNRPKGNRKPRSFPALDKLLLDKKNGAD